MDTQRWSTSDRVVDANTDNHHVCIEDGTELMVQHIPDRRTVDRDVDHRRCPAVARGQLRRYEVAVRLFSAPEAVPRSSRVTDHDEAAWRVRAGQQTVVLEGSYETAADTHAS